MWLFSLIFWEEWNQQEALRAKGLRIAATGSSTDFQKWPPTPRFHWHGTRIFQMFHWFSWRLFNPLLKPLHTPRLKQGEANSVRQNPLNCGGFWILWPVHPSFSFSCQWAPPAFWNKVSKCSGCIYKSHTSPRIALCINAYTEMWPYMGKF